MIFFYIMRSGIDVFCIVDAAYIGINSFALYFDFKAERFMNLFVLFSTALDLIEKFNAGLTPEVCVTFF